MEPVQQPAPPSRFQADLVSVALVVFTAAGLAMAFVLTQQHEPVPGYLEAMIVGGLTSLGFYKAANPQQQQAVAQLGQQVQQLGTAVDLNHLDTMQAIAAAPTAPTPTPDDVVSTRADGSMFVRSTVPGFGHTEAAPAPPAPAAPGALFQRLTDGTFIPASTPPTATTEAPAATLADGELDHLVPAAAVAAPGTAGVDMGGAHNVPTTPPPTEADLSALDARLAQLPPTPIPSPGHTIEV